jgi:hypothetical protein
MKISIIYRWIKAFSVAASLASCAPIVSEAPFVKRPDATEPGDLLGPFNGRAIDSSTSRPVPGAVVWASWGFDLGRGLVQQAGGDAVVTETDADGRWSVGRLANPPRGRARVARFTVVIYKPGWIAWRSDRRFEDDSARGDFSQYMSVARMERFTPTVSRARHVRFAGGGGAIRRAMAGEIVQAALELSGKSEAQATDAAPSGPLLDASVLLSADELKAATGYSGEFELGRLGDLPQATHYDSRHFKAAGKPESYDAALRVWRPGTPAAAEAQYQKLLGTVPNVEQKDEIADRSLRGHDGKILAAAALDKTKRVVVQLTCGVDQCRDHAQAVALLKRVMARIDRLGKAPEEPKERKVEPSEEVPDPSQDNPFKLQEPGRRY